MRRRAEPLEVAVAGERWRGWRWAGVGAPVLALHGFTGDGLDFAPLAEGLWARRPVWAVDLAGHGGSAAVAAHPVPAQVSGLVGILDALGLPAVELWGYSFGGRVALSLAVAHPERVARLGLIGATAGIADPAAAAARRAADAAQAARLLALGVEAWLAEWAAQPIIATQARIPAGIYGAMQARRRAGDAQGWAMSLRQAGVGAMPPVWDGLWAVRAPALVVAGAEDLKFLALAEGLAARLPHGEPRAVPGAGHCAHLEALPAFEAVYRAGWPGGAGRGRVAAERG